MNVPSFDIPAARKEISTKTLVQIEAETAFKWGSRAIAAYEMHHETNDVTYLLKGVDLEGEAIEHAAKAGEDVLRVVKATIDDAKQRLGVDYQL